MAEIGYVIDEIWWNALKLPASTAEICWNHPFSLPDHHRFSLVDHPKDPKPGSRLARVLQRMDTDESEDGAMGPFSRQGIYGKSINPWG